MKPTKSIVERISQPRIDEDRAKTEISDQAIELASVDIKTQMFEPATYRYIDVSDLKLKNGTFNTVICFRSTFVRVVIDSSQMTGLQLPEGNFLDFILSNSRVNLSNFRNATFTKCSFTDIDLSEADFSGSKLTTVRFERCMLDGADLSNCMFDSVEFVDCSLATISGITSFKGVTISEQNLIEIAPILASELGIRVQEF